MRRERGTPISDDARAALKAWIKENIPTQELADLERLDLYAFVRDTTVIDLLPEERLRQLAIFLEHEVTWRSEQPRSWLALDRCSQY